MGLQNNGVVVHPSLTGPIRQQNLTYLTVAITAGATKTSLAVADIGVNIVAGTKLIVMNPLMNHQTQVTLSSNYTSGDTAIQITSTGFTYFLPIYTPITISKKETYNKINTARIETENVNVKMIFSVGTGNEYDYLSNYSHDTQFNINSSASLSNGDSKNNNWGARYGCFVATQECVLLSVFGWVNTGGTSGSKPEAVVLSIWKKDSTANGTSATRIYLLSQTTHTFPASSAANYVEQIIDTPGAVQINKYDSVFVSIRRVGGEEHDRTATWYLDYELKFKSSDIL